MKLGSLTYNQLLDLDLITGERASEEYFVVPTHWNAQAIIAAIHFDNRMDQVGAPTSIAKEVWQIGWPTCLV